MKDGFVITRHTGMTQLGNYLSGFNNINYLIKMRGNGVRVGIAFENFSHAFGSRCSNRMPIFACAIISELIAVIASYLTVILVHEVTFPCWIWGIPLEYKRMPNQGMLALWRRRGVCVVVGTGLVAVTVGGISVIYGKHPTRNRSNKVKKRRVYTNNV
jgi:hypothetical protein